MMEDDLLWKTTDTDTDTNTVGGGWLLVKFPFKRVFPTAAEWATVRHFLFLAYRILVSSYAVCFVFKIMSAIFIKYARAGISLKS